jgi:hypothetical protein
MQVVMMNDNKNLRIQKPGLKTGAATGGINTQNSSLTRQKKLAKGSTPSNKKQDSFDPMQNKVDQSPQKRQMTETSILNKAKSSSYLNSSGTKSQKKLYNNYIQNS